MTFSRQLLPCFLLVPFSLAIKPDSLNLLPPVGRMSGLPTRTLWVWAQREDLRSLDSQSTAIATLDGTILLGRFATFVPRRQPVIYPSAIKRIAVVRIEAPGTIADGLERQTADLILDTVRDPSTAALQIDFDARRSQRQFYAGVIREVRRRMPQTLPLSITALASWCSSDDWLRGLPVDEAVPMFFRMEPDRRFAPPELPQFRIREPLCQGSIGISTHEPHPAAAGKRVYIFANRGWNEDLPLIAEDDSNSRNEP